MMSDIINDFFHFSIAVLSVLNPIGIIPVFLALTAGYSPEKLKGIIISCALSVTIGLIISAFLGNYILKFFGISLSAFQIAGGILISLNALSMLSGKLTPSKMNQKEIEKQKDTENIGLIPLAIPLLLGPGTISTVILYTKPFKTFQEWGMSLVVFLSMGVVVYLTQAFAKRIKGFLGDVGLNALTRIMGIILLAVGTEFIISAIKESFHI